MSATRRSLLPITPMPMHTPPQRLGGPETRNIQALVTATERGVLLSVERQPIASALTDAGDRYLVTYRSRGVRGDPPTVRHLRTANRYP